MRSFIGIFSVVMSCSLEDVFWQNASDCGMPIGYNAIGEPGICMSVSVAFALREAIAAARSDVGIPASQWFQIDGPYTREAIQLSTATEYCEYKFY